MTYFEKYQALAQALGWTMLHSIWQIALIYAVFRVLRIFIRQNAARYYGSLLAMTTSALWATVTFYTVYQSRPDQSITDNVDNQIVGSVPVEFSGNINFTSPSSTGWQPIYTWLENHAVIFGCLWCAGILFFSVRLLGGYWLSHRLRRTAQPVTDQRLIRLCRSLSERIGIRRSVQVLESPFIKSPLTVGFWKPVVLFPVGMMLQLNPAQVEVLLLHELAHIRRYDYLVNLFQMALEVCFFYHPLFRLLSREVDLRREYACDDLVLHHSGNAGLYATTLTEIKLYSLHPSPLLTMSAIGKSQFSVRVQRIMGFSPKKGDRSLPLFMLFLLTAIAIGTCWPFSSVANANNEPLTISFPAAQPSFVSDTVAPTSSAKPVSVGAKASPAPQPSPEVVVEMSNRRVLYIGLDNPLRVLASGVPANELVVKLVGSGKVSGQGVDYKVNVTTPGEVTIAVYRRQKNQESLLQKTVYEVKNIPDPTPLFAGLTSRKTTVDALLLQPLLSAKFDKVEFEVPYEIVGYELTTLPKAGDPVTHAVYSARLPEALVAEISQLPPGSAIFLDDIKIKCPGSTEVRNVGGISFKIAE